MSDERIQEFLTELTELSHKHGLGINMGQLYELEPEDVERVYGINEGSDLSFE